MTTPERVAYARAYELLAALVTHGLRDVSAQELRELPVLGAELWDENPSEDIETAFVTVFDLGVPPYASLFVEGVSDARFDHLGDQLRHLAQLTISDSPARARGFIAETILPWLPAWVSAVHSFDVVFWPTVATLVLDLVAAHGTAVGVEGSTPPTDESTPVDDPRSGLKQIAEYLARPSRCGAMLSVADLAVVGRDLDIPRGFGTRRQRIETMLNTAAELELVQPLCVALARVLHGREARLRELEQRGLDPMFTQTWRDRIGRTHRMLETIGSAAASAKPTQPNPGATP